MERGMMISAARQASFFMLVICAAAPAARLSTVFHSVVLPSVYGTSTGTGTVFQSQVVLLSAYRYVRQKKKITEKRL